MRSALSRSLAPALGLILAFAMPAALLAQEDQRDSPLVTILFTWTPVLVIVGLWVFFMRKMGWWGGKGGYRQYMATSQERMESIDRSLQRIANQMEKLTEVLEKSGPRS